MSGVKLGAVGRADRFGGKFRRPEPGNDQPDSRGGPYRVMFSFGRDSGAMMLSIFLAIELSFGSES